VLRLRGDANATVNPSQTATFAFNTFGCSELEEWGRRKLASPVECKLLVPLVLDRCQCQAANGNNITTTSTSNPTEARTLAPTALKTSNTTTAESKDGSEKPNLSTRQQFKNVLSLNDLR